MSHQAGNVISRFRSSVVMMLVLAMALAHIQFAFDDDAAAVDVFFFSFFLYVCQDYKYIFLSPHPRWVSSILCL